MDAKFRIETLSAITNPNQVVWLALHQDYSSEPVYNSPVPDEDKAGEIIVNRLLKGGRGHFGCLEHPQIVLNCCYFPHSTMQQLRTHRVGVSFDVQSFRYTSAHIFRVVDKEIAIEDVFYLRPVGYYRDRNGANYFYSHEVRQQDLDFCYKSATNYATAIKDRGFSEEHARGLIPFDIRQHFVLSCNARSLMHLLDLRWKADAQLEIQQFSELLFAQFKLWMPQIADWYLVHRAKRARLSP